MKTTLLILSLFASFASIGQKKITAISDKYFNESGVMQLFDSTAYNYTSWQGSINELKPKFKFAGDIIGFTLDEVMVHSNSENRYSGSPSPITLTATTNNTLTNGLVTESNNAGNIRTLYEYTSAGKVKSATFQLNVSSSWETQDSTVYTYDSFGNQLTMNSYNFSLSMATLIQSDSAWYISGSDKLTQYKSYYDNGGTLVLDFETIVVYSGNNVQTLDLYFDNGSGVLEWTYRLNYNYIGSNCSDFVAYDVLSNVPTTTVFATGTFTYTSQNQPLEQVLIVNGNPSEKSAFTYDADGYIKTRTFFSADTANLLYLSDVRTFYYQSTVGLENLVDASVSIFPNPAKDVVKIHSTGSIQNVQVLNLAGQQVLEQKTPTIDVQHLPAGTYIINGTTDKGSFSKKIVKE